MALDEPLAPPALPPDPLGDGAPDARGAASALAGLGLGAGTVLASLAMIALLQQALVRAAATIGAHPPPELLAAPPETLVPFVALAAGLAFGIVHRTVGARGATGGLWWLVVAASALFWWQSTFRFDPTATLGFAGTAPSPRLILGHRALEGLSWLAAGIGAAVGVWVRRPDPDAPELLRASFDEIRATLAPHARDTLALVVAIALGATIYASATLVEASVAALSEAGRLRWPFELRVLPAIATIAALSPLAGLICGLTYRRISRNPVAGLLVVAGFVLAAFDLREIASAPAAIPTTAGELPLRPVLLLASVPAQVAVLGWTAVAWAVGARPRARAGR